MIMLQPLLKFTTHPCVLIHKKQDIIWMGYHPDTQFLFLINPDAVCALDSRR